MNQDDIRKGFQAIVDEAGTDERLARRITEKLTTCEKPVPVEALKTLLRYFIATMLPTALLHLALSSISLPLTGGVDLTTLAEQNTTLVWQSIDISANASLILLWFARGTLRAFSILLTFTFILAAAGMPVCQHHDTKGGLSCSA